MTPRDSRWAARLGGFACAGVLLCALGLIPFNVSASTNSIPKSLRGDGSVTLFRPDKQERATIQYRDLKGRYLPHALEEIAYAFRCRMTDETHPIDTDLIEILDAIEDRFEARELKLVSPYRSPTRNLLMRRQGRGVARDSLHMRGQAADIEITGISKESLRDFAAALHQGGVGYYRRNPFVHVDSGSPRTWGFKPNLTRTRPATSQK